MLIPLANLQPDPNPVRRIFDPAADAELLRSLTSAKQIEPILVVPGEGGKFIVKNGNRRLRFAAAAGLEGLIAHVLPGDEAFAAGAAVAANTLHQPLAPVDLWRALVGMQAESRTLADAAAFLGISDHHAARLDRLGRLAPEMLALIEQHGMPAERFLRTIAAAPLDMQAKAAKTKSILRPPPAASRVDWHQVAQLCTRHTYRRADAIFNVEKAKITWQRDVFAQPGDPDEWTTADAARFLKAQRAALAEMASDSKGKIAAVEESTRNPGSPNLPQGWRQSGGNVDKPKRNEVVYATISELTGELVRVVAIDSEAERRAEKEKERKAKEKAKTEAKAASSAAKTLATKADQLAPALPTVPSAIGTATPASEPAAEPEATAPTAEDAAPLTKEGQKILAGLKTDALRAKLRHPLFVQCNATDQERMVVLLILALHARNVEVKGYDAPEGARWGAERGNDILRRLVTPEGHVQYDAAELPRLASETLARVLSASPPDAPYHLPGSGSVAEWIGADISAESRMPLLTTAPFLATWKTPALKEAATAADLKFTTATAARRDLANTLAPDPDSGRASWLPTFAHFGAPGPKPAAGEG